MKITITEYNQHLLAGVIHSGKRVIIQSESRGKKTTDSIYFTRAANKYVFSSNLLFIDGYNFDQKLIEFYLVCIAAREIIFIEDFLKDLDLR